MKHELSRLASDLDAAGLYAEADTVDKLIHKIALAPGELSKAIDGALAHAADMKAAFDVLLKDRNVPSFVRQASVVNHKLGESMARIAQLLPKEGTASSTQAMTRTSGNEEGARLQSKFVDMEKSLQALKAATAGNEKQIKPLYEQSLKLKREFDPLLTAFINSLKQKPA